jgi:hypothetical protein
VELRIAVDLGRHAVTTAATRIPAHGHPVTTSTPSLAWVGPQGEVRCGVQAQVAARRDPAGVAEGWIERLFSVRVLTVGDDDGVPWRAADLLARLVEDPLRVSVLGLTAHPDEVTLVEVLLVVPHGWIEAQTRSAERILAEEVEALCPAAEVDVVPVPAARALASRLTAEQAGEDDGGDGAGAGTALVLDVGAQATTLHLLDGHGAPVRTERLPGLGGDRLDARLLAIVTERAGGVGPDEGEASARLRSAVADAREQLSTREAVDIPVEKVPGERGQAGDGEHEEEQQASGQAGDGEPEGEQQAVGLAAGTVALVQLTRPELAAVIEEDLEELVSVARDLTGPALPSRVLLVGGVASTPSLPRVAEAGLAPEGGGPPPAVLRDPSPTHAAVLGALSLAESQDRAWWSGAPAEVAGAATAGGRDRRPLVAIAGAVAVLVVGALAVAALQLGGDEDPPGVTDPPPAGVTSPGRTSAGPSTTDPAVATSEPTARTSSATDRTTATSSPSSDLPSSPPAQPDPVDPLDPGPPVPASPIPPAPAPPAPVPTAPVPPVPAPPTPVPTVPVPVPPVPTPPPTEPGPTPSPTDPTSPPPTAPTPPPTEPAPSPTEPGPTPPPTDPTPPPTEPDPGPPPAPVPPPTAPPTAPPDTEPAS